MPLRNPVEAINSVSKVKLKADPAPYMASIARVSERCLVCHPTLAVASWKRSISAIREALNEIESIYEDAP
jgi:hypothetical protein